MLRRALIASIFMIFAIAPSLSVARVQDMGGGYVCNIASTTSGDTTWYFVGDCFYMGDMGGGGGGGYPPDPPPSGGGGGGAGSYTVPRDSDNPENVRCSADGAARYLSARQDFLKWKASTRSTQIYGKGEILKISYLGGGDERYVWIPGTMASPTAPAEAMLARVPDSLSCPR